LNKIQPGAVGLHGHGIIGMVKDMSVFEAIILGAVQGLTEFLPVSSSGHLVLLQRIFGID
jgi:hypothetical protein